MTVHLPTLKQLQYLVALRRTRPFRQGGGSLLRHPVDPVGRPARARESAARSDPGRAHPAGRPLHSARRQDRREGACASCARRRSWPTWPGPRASRCTGELRMGVIPTIAPFLLPTMLPRLRGEWPSLKLYPARGDQPGGLRGAASRPARLRAARPALRAAATSTTAPCSTTRSSSPSRAAKRRADATRRAGGDRREPAAAARRRPLPEGSCALRLQPARTARRRRR